MTKDVELFSITAPDVSPTHVLYYTEFEGARSESSRDYPAVREQAVALIQEHDACLVDRSDKGTGLALGLRRR